MEARTKLSICRFLAAATLMSGSLSFGAVNKLITGYDGLSDSLLPQKLSQTGLYVDITAKNKVLTGGIVAFKPNSPLWSDDAHKTRWVQVPTGKKIIPSDSDHYQFPDSTVFIKNFAMDTVYGDTNTRMLHETRFLVIRVLAPDTLPVMITYKWNRTNTEAYLVSPTQGLDTAIAVRWGGQEVARRWRYPSNNDCAACHTGRNVLGFMTPQLNDKATGANNQLAKLVTAGVLASNPIVTKPSLANFRWYAANDASVSDSARARSYFGANCSQCHGNGHTDIQGASHDFDWFTPNKSYRHDTNTTNVVGWAAYVGKESSDPGYPKLVYPGWPESSYVMRRIMARGDLNGTSLYQMPPLATFQLDSVAFKMMHSFICKLGTRTNCGYPKDQQPDKDFWMFKTSTDTAYGPWTKPVTGVFPHKFSRRMHGFKVILNGRTLILEGGAAVHLKVTMHDLRGSEVPLLRERSGRYQISGVLRPGLYIVKSGRHMARVNVLP